MTHRLKHALQRSLNRERYHLLDGLLHNQTLSRAQLLDKQAREQASIIRFAYDHTPYYRDKFGALPDLNPATLPILRKDEVIRHRDAMVAQGLDKSVLKIGSTGGSTGVPVSFYYDNHKSQLMRAGMCRSYMGSGWRPGQKILNFWGARQDINGNGVTQCLRNFIAAEHTIPAYHHSEAQLQQWATTIRTYRPVLLQGYASILAELARHIDDNQIPLPDTLIGVYSTAEVLYGWQRELMERVFRCKVYNQYGSREIPNIACECRHGNLHVFTDMVYLESCPIDGEERIVLTSLTNRAMPFIRYENGDSGRLREGDCPCGSPFPMMEMGLCRSNDLIRTRHGKRVYPSYFTHLLDGLKDIRQFCFIQEKSDKITLQLVTPTHLDRETKKALQARIRAEVADEMVLEIRYLAEIKRTSSGKHRFVICRLA
jgi:phenylacetate-CoA ligase